MSSYKRVQIDEIVTREPRSGKAETALLSESVEKVGLLHAPVVVPDGKRFRLVAGAGRMAAARQVGQKAVWVLILDTEPDSPHAKLAFLDENLLRTPLPPAMEDEQWAARKRLLEQIDPGNKPDEKAKAGAKKGGRGKKRKPSPESGKGFAKPPSKETNAREQSEASHRVDGSARGTWDLYVSGSLTQSQVDVLVTIKDPIVQEQVARESVGKTVAG